MKKLFPLFIFWCALGLIGRAQYVTIPDAQFVLYLNNAGYAGCMSGSQLDTTCSKVVDTATMDCSSYNITDLTGIQYFKHLQSLGCYSNPITTLPSLPVSLKYLDCSGCAHLGLLPAMPDSLIELNCSHDSLSSISAFSLSSQLKALYCSNISSLSTVVNLPSSIQELDCSYTGILGLSTLNGAQMLGLRCSHTDSLTILPSMSLDTLICSSSRVMDISQVNIGTYLDCSADQYITGTAASFGTYFFYLDCSSCPFFQIPTTTTYLLYLNCSSASFPPPLTNYPNLQTLYCSNVHLIGITFTNFPSTLMYLDVSNDNLTSLDSSLMNCPLQGLSCVNDSLTSIPFPNPSYLSALNCSNNKITILPLFPAITSLYCDHNLITSIGGVSNYMQEFVCNNNPGLTCLPPLGQVTNLDFSNTAITCLPNYGTVSNSNPPLSLFPLCDSFNSNNCTIFWNIAGNVFYDSLHNCIYNTPDVRQKLMKVELYRSGALQQQVFTGGEGFYSFKTDSFATYTTQLDSTQLPFTVSCPDSGYYTSTISIADSLWFGQNFALRCRVGYDVGVWNLMKDYSIPRPADIFILYNTAGDISDIYGAHCAAGLSGQVQLIFTGLVTYMGPAAGALTPSMISGDTITWNIADFGTVADSSAFNLIFQIDTVASEGTYICFNETVTPTANDFNLSNNTANYCFVVVDALDPNRKQVSPVSTLDANDPWLTYTIYFQNTGTGPALNIYVLDTLNSNLDLRSFQFLTGSFPCLTQILPGGVAKFSFANINLPDSSANEPASHGWVQYKIKAKDSLPDGAQITNTAYIYFDLNASVVTNTTVNGYCGSASITQISNDTLQATGTGSVEWIDCNTMQAVAGANANIFTSSIMGSYAAVFTNGACSDTTACLQLNPLGIKGVGEVSVNLYPNPSNNVEYVVIGESGKHSLRIFDGKGALISEQTLSNMTSTIDMSALSNGLYLFEVSGGDWKVRKRVVKME